MGIHVAIVGAGITGVILALGLERRGVSYTLYERAPAFTEIGAGIGFSPNAESALMSIDPLVHVIYKKVASSSKQDEYFKWVNGKENNEIIARLFIGYDAFQGGRRYEFLEAWGAHIPAGRVRFNKEIESLVQRDDGKVDLRFKDGTSDEADIVIGCDGLRSRVRQLMLGEENPASFPRYTGNFCFRSLIPMEKAQKVLSHERTLSRHMYNGPDAHIITYPVAGGTLLNALFVGTDTGPWQHERHTAPGTKAEVVELFKDWHPSICGLVDLLPEKLDKWGLFDMYDHPAPCYNFGCVAIAGDAAHASGPHLGSGAGFGIEDALVLSTVLECANRDITSHQSGKATSQICRDALAAYNAMRFDRDQWLPGATRKALDLFHWRDEEVGGTDHELFLKKIHDLFHTIWDNDLTEMQKEAREKFQDTLLTKP
ncbi:hypothetical protein F4808DRAFT_398805 [Astrocystis sublimbata]|nr:hypothetical protein F4808DRAFT_398805 [Astrocystis sublimbata]